MGGPGSGRHGFQGRQRGGHNSATAIEAMRAGMRAAHALMATQPENCQKCGEPGFGDLSWCCLRDENDKPGERQWLCGVCLTGPMVPLKIEDFVYSRTSNLGVACEHHGMQSFHNHGPNGDRAISTPATRAARQRRSA
jgi:hypothetical protein